MHYKKDSRRELRVRLPAASPVPDGDANNPAHSRPDRRENPDTCGRDDRTDSSPVRERRPEVAADTYSSGTASSRALLKRTAFRSAFGPMTCGDGYGDFSRRSASYSSRRGIGGRRDAGPRPLVAIRCGEQSALIAAANDPNLAYACRKRPLACFKFEHHAA